MPTDAELIPAPVLDDRLEADRIARRQDRVIGNYTRDDAVLVRDTGEALISIIDNNESVIDKLNPELSSVRPAEAHIAMLTEFEKMGFYLAGLLNQVPNQNRIEMYRILGVTIQAAVAATTTLTFTKSSGFLGQSVTVPAGTEVGMEDTSLKVVTDADLVIAINVASGSVAATCSTGGDIGRIPAGVVTRLLTSVAGIDSVQNSADLAGGRNAETVDQAKIRAREEMSTGNHVTTVEQWKDLVYFDILRRKGRVTAFEQKIFDFSDGGLGHLLLVIQGESGLAPSNNLLTTVSGAIATNHVAGVSIIARGPEFVSFDIEADVTIRTGPQTSSALKTNAEANLRARFNPLTFDYGPEFAERVIDLSDIVGRIEDAGPNQISVKTSQNLFSVKIIIDEVEYQSNVPLSIGALPLLGTVTLNTVQ